MTGYFLICKQCPIYSIKAGANVQNLLIADCVENIF